MTTPRLIKGSERGHGIVAATSYSHGVYSPYGGTSAVVKALKEHHDMSFREVPGTQQESSFFPYEQASEQVGGGDNAIVMRILHGAGMLSVDGAEVVGMDTGDWAYIPPGVAFVMTGMVISGMNLQFMTSEVVPC